MIFHEILTSIAKEPYSFVILMGFGSPDPTLDPLMLLHVLTTTATTTL